MQGIQHFKLELDGMQVANYSYRIQVRFKVLRGKTVLMDTITAPIEELVVLGVIPEMGL
jgi:hypothetical protein